MTLRSRRILYLSFIFTFLIIAPILVLYTTGYRWNKYRSSLQKIGSLVIKTSPSEVNIEVANINVTKTTPWRYNNLLPNEYEIKVSKKGYEPWSKKLTIYPGETTFADHIFLFKNNSTPQLLVSEKVDFWTYEKNNDITLYTTNGNLKIINHRNENIDTLLELNSPINNTFWSDDYSKLLIQGDEWWLWETNNRYQLTAMKDIYGEVNNCRFRKGYSDAIYCQTENKIIEHHLLTQENKELINTTTTEKIIDFFFADKTYYLCIDEQDNNVYLKTITIRQDEEKLPDFLLPKSLGYRFISADNNQAIIFDQQNDILYILNLASDESDFNRTSRIIKDVKKLKINDQGHILYHNDWEVWIYRNGETELITRQSQPIIQANWYPSDNHILVTFANGMKLIELDRRDKQNTTTVSDWYGIKKASLDKEANYIYFTSKENNLFSLEILEKDPGFETPNWTP